MKRVIIGLERVLETVKTKERKSRMLKMSGVFKTRDSVEKGDRAIDKIEWVIVSDENILMICYKWVRGSFKFNLSMIWYRVR